MELIIITIIAIALAIDSFAISLAEGMEIKKLKIKRAIKFAFIFSLLDAIMVLIGWIIGAELDQLLAGTTKWIVFGLLSLAGIQIIYNSLKNKQLNKVKQIEEMAVADFAASLDALLIGPSLFLMGIPLITTIIVIGAATFILSISGMLIGKEFRTLLAKKIKLIGIISGILIVIIAIINLLN